MPAATLAQLPSADAAAAPIPPLPAPPALEHYLLENPYPALALLLAAAMTLGWLAVTGRAGRHRWMLPASGALAAAAMGVFLISTLVITTRETLILRTRELIRTVAAADTAALGEMLTTDVSFRLFSAPAPYTRERLLELVRQYPGGAFPVESHSTSQAGAVMDSPELARTQVYVRARSKEATLYDYPIGSWWRLDWRKNGAVWKVSAIECLRIDGVGAGSAPRP